MAKVTFGPIISEARNKLGGQVFTRNRGGSITRQHVIPINPHAPQQLVVRGNFHASVIQWQTVLTDPQRLAWEGLAPNLPSRATLDKKPGASGFNAFMSLDPNVWFNTGAHLTDPPPLTPPTDPGTIIVSTNTHVGPSLKFAVGNAATATDVIVLRATPPISPGILSIRRPAKFLLTIYGPAANPFDITAAYVARFGAPIAGKRIGIFLWYQQLNSGLQSLKYTASSITA